MEVSSEPLTELIKLASSLSIIFSLTAYYNNCVEFACCWALLAVLVRLIFNWCRDFLYYSYKPSSKSVLSNGFKSIDFKRVRTMEEGSVSTLASESGLFNWRYLNLTTFSSFWMRARMDSCLVKPYFMPSDETIFNLSYLHFNDISF